jgi:hypothetical protein
MIRDDFREIYAEVVDDHAKNVISKYPIILQDLLNMTLVLPGREPERYMMNKKRYFLMAGTSHPLLTIYSILASKGFASLPPASISRLTGYAEHLKNAKVEVTNAPPDEVSADLKARVIRVLDSSIDFIQKISQKGSASRQDFQDYVTPLRPLINQNFEVGAAEQLTQFRAQMMKWRSAYPDENWNELRVVILGFHQPRNEYAMKLFFQWLLNEPGYEKHVIYAEFQDSISDTKEEKKLAAAQALAKVLLTKVDLEQEASTLIFGDPKRLQIDVMGPASADLLKQWGTSTWPHLLPKGGISRKDPARARKKTLPIGREVSAVAR